MMIIFNVVVGGVILLLLSMMINMMLYLLISLTHDDHVTHGLSLHRTWPKTHCVPRTLRHFDLKMENKPEDVTQDTPPVGDEQLEHQQMDKVYDDMENMTLDNGVMRRKNMKVIVHCNSRSSAHKPAKYEIAVGRGKQNFRWLGLVAAGRYKNECRLNGRLRQREVDATRSSVSQNVPTVCCM